MLEYKVAQIFTDIAKEVPTTVRIKKFFQNSPKSQIVFGLLLQENLRTSTFQIHPIWSHWQ